MGHCGLDPALFFIFLFNWVGTQSNLFVTFDNKLHVASLGLLETRRELLGERVQLDVVFVSDHFCCQTLHAVEELFVCLHLITWHILVKDVPKLCQNWPFNDLRRFVWPRDPSLVELFDKDLILCAVHLELELLLGVGVRVQGQILLNFMSFADDRVSEDAFAKYRVEVIIVQKCGLLALDYVSYVFLRG